MSWRHLIIAMGDELLILLATKLRINTPKVLRKAQEFIRLTDVKIASSGMNLLNLSGSSKYVLCLDLAATAEKMPIDKAFAVKLAGVTKKTYYCCLQALEQCLEIGNKWNIKDICVQFGCIEATELAARVLKCYEEEKLMQLAPSRRQDLDVSKPVFLVTAVYAACRSLKVKVDRLKLMEVGRTKKNIFDKLTAEMEEQLKKLPGKVKARQKRHRTLLELVEEKIKEQEEPAKKSKCCDAELTENVPTPSYEEWRRKILESAAKTIQQNTTKDPDTI